MYSLSYGTPPVATAVGGLRDTIVSYPNSEANGFIFDAPTPQGLLTSVRKAVTVWEDREAWAIIQRNAMLSKFSWEKSAREYIHLYQSLHRDITLSRRTP